MTVLQLIRTLFSYMRAYRLMATLVVIGLAIEMGVNALVPLAFKVLIDDVLPTHDHRLLTIVIVALSGGILLLLTGAFSPDWLYARLAAHVTADLRTRLFTHIESLSVEFFSRTESAQIVARFSSDLASVEQAIGATKWGVLATFDVMLATVVLLVLDWRLALVAMLLFPFCLAGPRLLEGRAIRASYAQKESEGETLATVQEQVATQIVVKAFGLEDEARRTFEARNAELTNRTIRVRFLSALIERLSGLGILAVQVAMLAVGALMAFNGSVTIGTLVAFQALFINLSYALYNVGQFAPILVQASAGMQRIEEILQESPNVLERADAVALPRLEREISLNGVSFAYAGREMSLRDVNIEIPRGRFIAIVGASGSGKSTIANMLLRFHDPAKGSIRFDGHDIRAVTPASLRGQLGMVFQENLLFDTSLRQNIRMGRLDASDEEIEKAARAAEVHSFIETLPNQYDERAGERGNRLSGGQRQRIAIARAMLRDPAVLILDEATSALDPATESAINETISRIARGRTVVSMTHRLSSVMDADCIYVMEQGRVIEAGRHDALVDREGTYARLWEKQTGLHADITGLTGTFRAEGLRRVRLLERLDQDQLEALAPYLVAENFPRDRVIVREGDPGDKPYILLRGRVEVTHVVDGGDERVAILEDGDFFGELALLYDVPRAASVRSLAFCTCLTLARGHFLDLLDRYPSLQSDVTALAERRRAETIRHL